MFIRSGLREVEKIEDTKKVLIYKMHNNPVTKTKLYGIESFVPEKLSKLI